MGDCIHSIIAARRAAGEVYELPLAAQSDTSDCGQLCLLWCSWLPQMMETIAYMGIRAISDVVLKVVASATSCRTCSCRIPIFGWTMTCKWGHPVATLPSDEGDYTSLCGGTKILQIITPSPGTNQQLRVHSLTTFAPTVQVTQDLPGVDPNYQITAPKVQNLGLLAAERG
eukprot:6173833-Pleurochrysis_carterae.AAC.1